MKLVELLVKELVKWPECVTYFVQDMDGEVKAAGESEPREPREPSSFGTWTRRSPLDNYNFYSGLCTDWETSIVTKDIYTKHKEETTGERQMKLVELLVKELVKWPECVTYFVQDMDGEVKAAGESEPREPREPSSFGTWTRRSPLDNYNFYSGLCTDWETSIVTKDIYTKHKEEKKKGHVHAELMAQYAEDAMTHAEPWKLWQVWQVKADDGAWWDCGAHPRWANDTEYRRKPNTKLIHGVEIPVFEFTPKVGEKYYVANVGLPEFFDQWRRQSEDCTFTQRMLERGLLYPYTEAGKQAAILHSKAMLDIAYLSLAH